jgi:hypothetical protein
MSITYIEGECGSCKATGLYHGFMEPKGVAVICAGCKGSGKITYQIKSFKERKKKEGIDFVILEDFEKITYEEFQRRFYPVSAI